jgi:hypothetical protein
MVTQHVRIKENAHLMNSELCHGCPEKFQFGTTSFADMEQAKTTLLDSFIRYDARAATFALSSSLATQSRTTYK